MTIELISFTFMSHMEEAIQVSLMRPPVPTGVRAPLVASGVMASHHQGTAAMAQIGKLVSVPNLLFKTLLCTPCTSGAFQLSLL